jgi:hypothetical protein
MRDHDAATTLMRAVDGSGLLTDRDLDVMVKNLMRRSRSLASRQRDVSSTRRVTLVGMVPTIC